MNDKRYRIFTQVYSIEEAYELASFIMSKGYEGVQNDSSRYNKEMIRYYFKKNLRHHKETVYIGVNSEQLVVSDNRRFMTKRYISFIPTKRKFMEVLGMPRSLQNRRMTIVFDFS